MTQGFSVSWSSNIPVSLSPQLWKPNYDSLWPCIGNIAGEGQRGWMDPSHIHASFTVEIFVSRVCLRLFRRVLLCRHAVCKHLFHSLQCAHSDPKLYNPLIFASCIASLPLTTFLSPLRNNPTFYLTDCISDSPFLPFFPQGRAVLMPFQG